MVDCYFFVACDKAFILLFYSAVCLQSFTVLWLLATLVRSTQEPAGNDASSVPSVNPVQLVEQQGVPKTSKPMP